jgi:hypothetical protein
MFVLLMVDKNNNKQALLTNLVILPPNTHPDTNKLQEICRLVLRLIKRWGEVRLVLPLLLSILTIL